MIQNSSIFWEINVRKPTWDDFQYAFLTSEGVRAWPELFYPAFAVAHILICILMFREDAGRDIAFRNPTYTWFSCLLLVYSGDTLVHCMLCKAVITIIEDERTLFATAAMVGLVFMSPFDLFYRVCTCQPIYIALHIIKELERIHSMRKAMDKVDLEISDEVNFKLPFLLLAGVVQGNGPSFLLPVTRFLRGVAKPETSEVMQPTPMTKLCILSMLLLTISKWCHSTFMSLTLMFVGLRIYAINEEYINPFEPFERFFTKFACKLNHFTIKERFTTPPQCIPCTLPNDSLPLPGVSAKGCSATTGKEELVPACTRSSGNDKGSPEYHDALDSGTCGTGCVFLDPKKPCGTSDYSRSVVAPCATFRGHVNDSTAVAAPVATVRGPVIEPGSTFSQNNLCGMSCEIAAVESDDPDPDDSDISALELTSDGRCITRCEQTTINDDSMSQLCGAISGVSKLKENFEQ